jgi:3-phosphoglycerate kinase
MKRLNMMEKMTHISTGGGAFADFITKDSFPGIEALQNSYGIHSHAIKKRD